jgi:hypothetical protein
MTSLKISNQFTTILRNSSLKPKETVTLLCRLYLHRNRAEAYKIKSGLSELLINLSIPETYAKIAQVAGMKS